MFKQILELLMQNNYNVYAHNGVDLSFEGQITGVGETDFNITGQCDVTKVHDVKTFIIPHIAQIQLWENEEVKEAMIEVY